MPAVTAVGQAPAETRQVLPTVINGESTALDRYVSAADDSYRWKLVSTSRQAGCTIYVLDLVSQTWRTADDVQRTEWQHWLTIVVPDEPESKTAMLFIDGGRNGRESPKAASPELLMVAGSTRVVVAQLSMVPNQPLEFRGDGVGRYEDDAIAYTWDRFLETGDETWPLQLPMTKSGVRAMDAVQEFLQSPAGGNVQIDDFVVSGASKRGWTTWLVAAVDSRVKAIAPIVIDVLNVNVSMQHHYSAYGFWAPAIKDYVHHEIPHRRFESDYQKLLQIVDPYAYRDRLTMPKCIINATGDQFFLPDSSKFYFDELQGEKYLSYVPNTDHSLRGSYALDTLAAFLRSVATNQPRPEMEWEFVSDNAIQLRCKSMPTSVKVWVCENRETRDFRTETVGRTYKSSELQPVEKDLYRVEIEAPEQGWKAAFVECTFDVGGPTYMRCTTGVRVLPESLPFDDVQAPVRDGKK